MELIFLRNITGIHRGIDLSLRAEYSVFYNNLALDLSHVSLRNLALAFPTYGDIPKSETAARQNINLIFTLSY